MQLSPERRVIEAIRYKSTSSHSFPKSNCSQEASVARLSADSNMTFDSGSEKRERFGAFKTWRRKELSICEMKRKPHKIKRQ